jgi:outer membrane immunogenic protein
MSNKKELIAAAASVAAIAAAGSASAADMHGMNDWSGFYAGVGVGVMSGTLAGEGDGYTDYGLAAVPHISGFMGFNHELGNNLVLGAELNLLGPNGASQNGHDSEIGRYGIQSGLDAKAKVGYDLGQFMIYGFAGASAQISPIGDYARSYQSYGLNVGLGADVKVTDHVIIGAEWIHREMQFKDRYDTYTAPQNEFALRASYLFN